MTKVGGIRKIMVLWQAVFLAASPLFTAPPSNLTRLYYNVFSAKSHSTTTQYRQLRRLLNLMTFAFVNGGIMALQQMIDLVYLVNFDQFLPGTIGPFIREKIRRKLYHLYEHVLSKTRTARINGSRLISVLDSFSCECCP